MVQNALNVKFYCTFRNFDELNKDSLVLNVRMGIIFMKVISDTILCSFSYAAVKNKSQEFTLYVTGETK